MGEFHTEVLEKVTNLHKKSTTKANDGKEYGKYNFYISGQKVKKINHFIVKN